MPQSYFRRWSPDGNKVWAYRLLVPRAEMLVWDRKSIRSLAVRRDLYTSVGAGEESDRIERWLNREIEDPALPVLDRLCSRSPLTPGDRKRLARYIAALVARSPLWYSVHTRIMAEHLEGVLSATVERTLKEIKAAAEAGRPLPAPPPDADSSFRPVSIKIHRKEGEQPALHMRAVVGRETWLHSIEHIVNDLSVILETHDWQLFRPFRGTTWYTSDNPVIRLNAYGNHTYDLKGGFARPGGELILPLSPTDLLYAQVDRPRKDVDELPLESTQLLKRLITENAMRWIVAGFPSREAEGFRPRAVNLKQYIEEEQNWKRFHVEQSAAERELREHD